MKNLLSRLQQRFKKTPYKDLKVHPKNGKHIEYAFSCAGTHYYKMMHDYEMYQDRWAYIRQFASEMDMCMTAEAVNEFLDAMLKECTIGNDKMQIDLGRIVILINEMKYRTEYLFEPDSLYRLASCIYFDLSEDITTYDIEYNRIKTLAWKKKGILAYLYEEVSKLTGNFMDLSQQDLATYLSQLNQNLERQRKLILGQKDLKPKSKKETPIKESSST